MAAPDPLIPWAWLVRRGHCVQVQHRGLREASAIDLATIDFLVRAVKWLAPDIDYQAGASGGAALGCSKMLLAPAMWQAWCL